MNEVIYLFLRQMRRPAFVLLICYSIAIVGMCSIPTLDEDGNMTYFTIFQAFYWLSYTATTIGYGEVPHEFSDWQRIWVALSIYYTVPAWLYAAGKIIALLQDPLFQHAIAEGRFARRSRTMKQRFAIICGFGEAGNRLVKLLVSNNYNCVVIDTDATRIAQMSLDPDFHGVLAISGDASDVNLLTKAGIESPFCRAVIAITDDEDVNIKVALAAKLLSAGRERFQIICRTASRKATANAKSFATDLVINTNRIFAERMTIGLRRPSIAQLTAIAYGEPGEPFDPPQRPPAGRWVICGFGNLGQSLSRYLHYEGVDTVIIDDNPDAKQVDVQGTGTEAVTLREARLDKAQTIVAARDYDPDNLSIAMTAKMLQPSLYVIGKQNKSANEKLFQVAGFDRVMEEADLIVSQVFPYVARPALARYLKLIRYQNEDWGKALLERLAKMSHGENPEHHLLRIDEEHAHAVMKHLQSGHLLRLQSLWMRADDETTFNDAIALLLLRGDQEILLPNPAMNVEKNDRVLIAYRDREVVTRMKKSCQDSAELYWTLHGRDTVNSKVLRFIFKQFD